MEKHIQALSEQQNKIGHEVTIFYNDGNSISNRDIAFMRSIKLSRFSPASIGIFIFYAAVINHLILRKQKFDVVHIHGDWSSYLFGPVIYKLTKAKKLCYSFHGFIQKTFAHKLLLPFTAKSADVFFINGYEAYEKLNFLTKSIFQPSGIDEQFLKSENLIRSNDQIIITTVSNLKKVKNVKIIPHIAKEFPNIIFNVCGSGPEENSIINLITALKIQNVKLLGYLDNNHLYFALQQTDIFLLPSFEEGTPTSLLEAMAMGLPVVTTNAGHVSKELIMDKVNGLIIHDPSSVDEFVEAIKILLKNGSLRTSMGLVNRKKSKEYAWPNVSKNITRYYGD